MLFLLWISSVNANVDLSDQIARKGILIELNDIFFFKLSKVRQTSNNGDQYYM